MRSFADRFHEKTERAPNGCLLWTAARDGNGYGLIRMDRVVRRAHRAAWMTWRGVIPPGMLVCHRCDTPSCVNVDHLFLGTAADNAHDRDAKGRQVPHSMPGVEHPMSILDDDTVLRIRKRYAVGNITQQDLADSVGVSRPTISFIVNGKLWAHLPTFVRDVKRARRA